ncbi:MAG TPA: HD domain-containing phosphohydrolase [Methylomirabilota bacterium]|jgi:HD-GYP domain-containing protein (c-di-GMP phosphodiesterase class II)|nr:HD domain-containing phosphohydrolase [Methylomirabilota bacterium]
MPRRVVWYPAGSPAASLLSALPGDLEATPLPARGLPRSGPDEGAVVLVDLTAGDARTAADLATRAPDLPVVALVAPGAAPAAACYAYVTTPAAPDLLAVTLRNACDHARARREADTTRREMEQLNQIGVSLSAERDTDALLTLILSKAREITRSDAGSVYLVEESPDGPARLRFKLAQNDSVLVPFTEFTLPIDAASVAGHVALTSSILQLDDAYVLPPGSPFKINREFDERVGYRTRSMLVVPMVTPQDTVIGVLQLINCKRDASAMLGTAAAVEAAVVPYPEHFRGLAASLASQAAVALENSRLYQSIQTLFEGFVQASVTAIESRDPTTSGHSFRVADFTVALAAAVDRAAHGPFRDVRFSVDEMKEIRYASLLHDFGKVGVREDVLVKAKKLPPGQLELIRQRGEIIRRGLELRHARRKTEWLLQHGRDAFADRCAEWDAELAAVLADLDVHLKAVAAANEPTVMPDDVSAGIRDLAGRAFLDHLGDPLTLITPEEARVLSIPRGSLTPDEYRQIQSHVVHTYQFLRQIPWTKELRRIPEIARSHHEKLNGSGYPAGWRAPEIPVQTRMMTISDIFDALTSRDRPYKPAVPVERALDILGQERQAGALDGELLSLFIAVRPWERVDPA